MKTLRIFAVVLLAFCAVPSQAALSRTELLNEQSAASFGTGSFTTASFSPPDNSILVVSVGLGGWFDVAFDPSSAITASGGSLTYTSRTVIGQAGASFAIGSRIFTAPVTTGSSMTVTVGTGGTVNTFSWHVMVVAYTGYDTGTPTGATATDGAAPTSGSASITLSSNPASGSEVVAFLFGNGNSAGPVTAGTGWTELYDNFANFTGSQLQIRTGSTSTTVGWDAVCVGGGCPYGKLVLAALEINVASAGAAPSTTFLIQQMSAANDPVYDRRRRMAGLTGVIKK